MGNRGWLCVLILKSSQAFLYSKHWKCLKEISKFWKSPAEAYNKRSDEGADMESQEECDHGVCPTDPNIMVYKKK